MKGHINVAQRFRGESVHKVDGKGRVSIPALFRRVLEAGDPDFTEGLTPNLVIVYGGAKQKYLEVYTQEAIAEVDALIGRMPRGSKERRYMEHMFNGQSLPTSTDDTGRLVLSQKLRDKVGIGSEAYFKAAGDTFQIWAADAYETKNADMEDWLDEQGDDFDPLILLKMAAPASDV